ncbi:MAG: T9SS type A sorting domain-containing protein [Flavipsychrobacter sp.]
MKRINQYLSKGMLGALCVFVSYSSIAQTPNRWKTIFPFTDDVKQYSTEMLYNTTNLPFQPTPDASAMAGTIYYTSAETDAHYILMHELGGKLASVSYNHLARIGSHPNIDRTSMKVVDLEAVEIPGFDDEMLITCQSRERDGSTPTICIPCPWVGNIQNDFITVMRTDLYGNVLDALDIWDNSDGNGLLDFELYPTHTLYKKFTYLSNNYEILYICGTATTENTSLPNQPDYKHDKKAFVIAVDVSNNQLSVLGNITFNYRSTGTTIIPSPGDFNGRQYDFDIAMHLDWITSGSYIDHVMVSGSVNGEQPNPLNPGDPNTEYNRSAAMNLVLNPVTLAIQADFPYMSKKIEEQGENEYSIGLMEHSNALAPFNYKYQLGNKFYISDRGEYPYSAYGMWVNRLHADLFILPSATPTMYTIDGEYWGMKIMPTYGQTPIGTQTARTGHFLISGFQTEDCNFTFYKPSMSNMTAFLVDLHVDYWAAPGDKVRVTPKFIPPPATNPGQWTSFNSTTGTGGYAYLGGGLSNSVWYNTEFAARNFSNLANPNNGDDEVIMYTPKYQPDGSGSNILGFAYTAADNDFYSLPDAPLTCGPEHDCDPTFYEEEVMAVASSTNNDPLVLWDANAAIVQNVYDDPVELICQDYSSPPGISSYKNGATVKNIMEASETKVFPNPTNDHVFVNLSSAIDKEANITVELINIQGQHMGNLYKGRAELLNNQRALSLPDVAPGLYLITISDGREQLHKEKLTIQ